MSTTDPAPPDLAAENKRLRAELDELRAVEQRFRTTLYAIGDGVIATDAGGRVLQMNAAAEGLTKWSESEARGLPADDIFRIVNEETGETVESPIQRVLREGNVVGLANHTVLIARDGSERPIADSGAPIRDPAGNISGVVLVFRDQTAEREAEVALAEAEERFRTFFDNAPIGKCMTDPGGGLLRVNPAFGDILGYTMEEMQRVNFAEITHPDDLAESKECVRSLLAGERDTWKMEKRYIKKGGGVVWTLVTTRLQRGESGEPLNFLTHVQDITERKRAESDLKERVKELTCLQAIGGFAEDEDISFYELLQKSADILPVSWIHEEHATSRILLDDMVFETGDMGRCLAKQSADIVAGGKVRGSVEVGYDREFPDLDEGPFLKEERSLIDAVAGRLGHMIERFEYKEEMIRERETLLAVLDGIDDVIYVADPETYDLLHVNEACKTFWGDDLVGQKCHKVLQGRDEPCPFCTNDKIFGEYLGESYVWEFQNEATGEWFRCSDKAIRWVDGRMVRFELAGNITTQKEQEAALRESEERFRRITEAAPDMIYCMSLPGGRYEYVNPAAEQVFGYPPGDFIENPLLIRDAIHPDWLDYFANEWEKLLADQAPPIYEYQIVNKKGETRWLNQRNVVMHGEDGAPGAIWGIVTDITRAKEDQQAILDSKREIEIRNKIAQAFLSASGEDLYADVLEVVLDALESRHGVFGYIGDSGELIVPSMTRRIWDQCQVDDKDVVFPREEWGDSIWARALLRKTLLHSNECSKRTPEGHIPVDRNVAAPIIYQDNVIGLLQVANKESDYTGRDLAMIETLAGTIAPTLHGRLSREKEERLRRLAEAELKEKAEGLARSNKELEQFAYVASHDLQEPLRMVASYTELLARRYEGQLDDKADKYINYAVEGAKRMQGLINDLLAFSRVGTRAEPLEPVDCNEVLDKVLQTLDKNIEESGATIEAGDMPMVLADRGQLSQVFQNLVSNAIKFRGEAPPKVRISALQNGPMWEISVSDNGIGIDPKYFDRIFIIFQRLHGRESYEGSGIGLLIVKKIVERHGGRVWIEPSPDGGSRFTFTMPAQGGTGDKEHEG